MNQISLLILLIIVTSCLPKNLKNSEPDAEAFSYVQKKNITSYYMENTISPK